MSRNKDDLFGSEETARRRDEVVRRMANTPPQPRVRPPDRPKKKRSTASDRKARKSGPGDKDA